MNRPYAMTFPGPGCLCERALGGCLAWVPCLEVPAEVHHSGTVLQLLWGRVCFGLFSQPKAGRAVDILVDQPALFPTICQWNGGQSVSERYSDSSAGCRGEP